MSEGTGDSSGSNGRRRRTVLVTAAGTIVAQGIIKSLKLAASKSGSAGYRIVSTDMSAQAVGLYRGDVGVLVPSASSPGYIDSIVKLCNEERVDAIFVGAEEELVRVSQEKDRIEGETGAIVLANPPEVVSIGTDKWKTFEFLREKGLPCAESALPEGRKEFVRERGYPVVVKPREGHGSLHFYLVRNGEQLQRAVSAIEEGGWRPMLQEHLAAEDQEFSAGVTVDQGGASVMSSIAMRRTLRGGQTYRALIDDFPEVRKAAEEAALSLGARGAINVQSRLAEGGKPKTFEINPRFSASCPMRSVAGVNEPDIVYRNSVLGEQVKVREYQKLICMRYWNEVYLPVAKFEEMTGGRLAEAGSFIPDYF